MKSGKPRGREEADVIGLKFRGQDILEIVHVEAGSLDKNFKDNFETVKRKFNPDRIEIVKTVFSNIIGIENVVGRAMVGRTRLVEF